MLSVKQRHQVLFLSLLYDSTWNKNPFFRANGEHTYHYADGSNRYILKLFVFKMVNLNYYCLAKIIVNYFRLHNYEQTIIEF